ncbi:hypothetical protein [Nocardia sp. NBC_01009]|uniref:hypothetical protein n=1 Tax=Nocardia sp. NBC_01009 TaxID=2975996 RepID=UPI00386D9847|nr:hypothetical protein OHA42_32600 [Nocardia sp. NBC_01009]
MTTIAHPELMRESGNQTTTCEKHLLSLLQQLAACQDELHAAVRGDTGTAIYSTLGNAHERGSDLANHLARIIEQLTLSGVKFDAAAQAARATILADLGDNGAMDTGNVSGEWGDGRQEVIDREIIKNNYS